MVRVQHEAGTPPRDGTPSKQPRRFGQRLNSSDVSCPWPTSLGQLECGAGLADAASAGQSRASTSGAPSPKNSRRSLAAFATRAQHIRGVWCGLALAMLIALATCSLLARSASQRVRLAQSREGLAALEFAQASLRERMHAAEGAQSLLESMLSELRAQLQAEKKATHGRLAGLEAQLSQAAAARGAGSSKAAAPASSAADGTVRSAAGSHGAHGSGSQLPSELALTLSPAGKATTSEPAAKRSAAAAAAGAEATPATGGRGESSGAQVATEVTLSFEFPSTPLLGPSASLYWVSPSADLELWYADLANGRPAPLRQLTAPGTRWRVRDSNSGNHLLSLTAPERDTVVAIRPSLDEVTLEFHRPDLQSARAAAMAAGTGTGADAAGVSDGAQSGTPSGDAAREVRVYKLKEEGGSPDNSLEDPRTLQAALEGAALLGRLSLDGRLSVMEARPGDRFVAVSTSEASAGTEALATLCLDYVSSHELHQHVNVRCGPRGSKAGLAGSPHLVRVEFMLGGGASNGTLLRLSELPFAWHVHSALEPRRPQSVITEPGERWQVRARDGEGRVLADVVASAQDFQRVLVAPVE